MILTITSTSSTLMTKEADLLSPPPRGSIRRSSVATGDIAKIVSYHSATFSSAVRGDHYEVMAVQKGCHHAFCNPAAVKTHTRLTSPLSFKMSARADPCSFTVSFLLSLSWHWHILENGSHTFWSFGNHLLYKLRQNYKSKNTNWVKTKILAHCLKLFSVETLIQIAMEVIRVDTLWEWIQNIYHSYFPEDLLNKKVHRTVFFGIFHRRYFDQIM